MSLHYFGLIPFFFGFYCLLVAFKKIPASKDPEQAALWHRKFGRWMKYLAPVVILSGVAQFFGLVDYDAPASNESRLKAAIADGNLVMHRAHAGTPDASGWYHADSTEGSFSVSLPLRFNDFTVYDPATKSLAGFAVGTSSKEGIKFSVMEIPFSKDKPIPTLESIAGRLSKADAQVTMGERKDYDGLPAQSFQVDEHDTGSFVRVVITPKSIISLIVEYPYAYKDLAAAAKQKFFDSLKLKAS